MSEENKLTEAVQKEALTRPVIGGVGIDVGRQSKLNAELGMDPRIKKARKLFDKGKISLEEFNRIAGLP